MQYAPVYCHSLQMVKTFNSLYLDGYRELCSFRDGSFGVEDLLVLLAGDRFTGQGCPQHPVIPQTCEIVGLNRLIIRQSHIIILHI